MIKLLIYAKTINLILKNIYAKIILLIHIRQSS